MKAQRRRRLCIQALPPLAILVAFAIRLWGLTATSLWYDETFMLYHAQQRLPQALLGLLHEDNALPLYGLLLTLWLQVAGHGEFVARYLSVLLGVLATPLVFRLGRALSINSAPNGDTAPDYAGLGSALAYATLPIFVYYTQEVRMYALAIPLAAGFAWIGWRLLILRRDKRLYIVLGLLMLLAHLYTGLTWLSIGLWGVVCLLIAPPRARRLIPRALSIFRHKVWWRANLWLALGATPIVLWALWRVRVDATSVSAIPTEALTWIPVLFGVGQYLQEPWPSLFAAAVALTLLITLWQTITTRRYSTTLWLLVTLILPILTLLLMTTIKAKWSERYLLPSWGLALVTGTGLGWEILLGARTRRSPKPHRLLRGLGAGLVVLWFALCLPALARQAKGTWAVALRDEWHPRPDFRGVARHIEQHGKPDDAIVVVGGYAATTLDYYYDGPAHLFGLPPNKRILDTTEVVDLRDLTTLARETEGRERLWLVLWQQHLADPTDLIHSLLVEQCRRLPVSATYTNVGLLYFDLTACQPLDRLVEPPYAAPAAFEAPIQLIGYDQQLLGQTLVVDLWWEATGPMDEAYTVFVHLVGEDGMMVAQHDHIAGADTYPTNRWSPGTQIRDRFFLHVPEKPCEDCVLRVGLYTPQGRLQLLNGGDVIEIPLEEQTHHQPW